MKPQFFIYEKNEKNLEKRLNELKENLFFESNEKDYKRDFLKNLNIIIAKVEYNGNKTYSEAKTQLDNLKIDYTEIGKIIPYDNLK